MSSERRQSLWFEDGNVVLSIQDVLFKVHRSMLIRLSSFFRSRLSDSLETFEGLPMIQLEVGIANSVDVETLLQHLYHDKPLQHTSSFSQTARILRAATQLDFQDLRNLALCRLEELYPPQPLPFEYVEWPYLHEATQLALDCGARQLLPGLLYAVVTTSDFEIDENASQADPADPLENIENPKKGDIDENRGRILSPPTTRLCVKVMNRIMEYFTPILFTVPTSSHMECTGVFADYWMEYAIQPALIDSGVYKPLETLKKIRAVDWGSLGLCDSCCIERRDEWAQVAEDIWSKIDSWAELDTLLT